MNIYRQKLTAINGLRSHLGLGARIVDFWLLGVDTSLSTVDVEIAVVVHSLLEGVVLPAEDVVTVGGRTTGF